MRALPALLAVLLVVAGAAAVSGVEPATPSADVTASADVGPASPDGSPAVEAVPVGTPQVAGNETPENGSINVLPLPRVGPNRTAVSRQHVDLGPALGFATNETALQLETLTAVEHVESAESLDERQRRILGELNRVEQRVISLRSAQVATMRAFTDGDIEPRTALIRLARIDREARALEERRERIAALAQETPDFSIESSRLDSLERELDALTGPVRAHAVAVLQGQSPPARFYVATASESVVLSTIVGDAYVREAYRGDLRNRTDGRLSPTEAADLVRDRYPTIFANFSDTEVLGAGDSYLVRVSYPRGDLSVFVDSGSRAIFKEFQRRPLDQFEAGDPVNATKPPLRLQVNRTYPGGPLQIRLTDTDGDPVDANITVGLVGEASQLVGATGADGVLWTLSPGSRFTVTAIRGNSVVVLTVDPTPPPRVDGS